MIKPAKPPTFEVWMHLTDELRERLIELLKEQNVSWREIATIAGYRSHTYMQRLLRGEESNLKPAPAMRIAKYLGVPVGHIFLARSSSTTRRFVKSRGRAAA